MVPSSFCLHNAGTRGQQSTECALSMEDVHRNTGCSGPAHPGLGSFCSPTPAAWHQAPTFPEGFPEGHQRPRHPSPARRNGQFPSSPPRLPGHTDCRRSISPAPSFYTCRACLGSWSPGPESITSTCPLRPPSAHLHSVDPASCLDILLPPAPDISHSPRGLSSELPVAPHPWPGPAVS